MIIKTQAIVLSVRPFSETSQVVSWLSVDCGKISTIVKGAQRPRNFFLGRYDLFYTCELLFYLRLFQGLHIVKECFPLKSRPALRSRWRGTACASYFTGLTARVTPLHAPQHDVYELLEAALDFFSEKDAERRAAVAGRAASGRPQMPQTEPGATAPAATQKTFEDKSVHALEMGLYWFEMKLLELIGFSPVLQACLQCRRPLPPSGAKTPESKNGKNYVEFSAARGGVLCEACRPRCGKDSIRLAADTLALLRFWQSSRKTNAIRNTAYHARQIGEIGGLLGDFLQHHLETENTGRKIALSILRQ